jgi:CheY-like chemotaxis protein
MSQRVLAVLDDLFFTVKINESAKRAGLAIEFVKSEKDAVERAKTNPALVIIDLNCRSVDPLALVGKLKGIRLIGYLSHVQGELKQKAQEAGCDVVLARSAFSRDLPQILRSVAAQA